MKSVEFYSTPESDVMVNIDGVAELFRPHKSQHIEIANLIVGQLENFYPDTYNSLLEIYGSCKDRIMLNYKMASRFIRCNFGSYDTMCVDIDETGLFNFEQQVCPIGCECEYRGIICNPVYQSRMTIRELEVCRLIVRGTKLDEVAGRLFISKHTAATHLRHIHKKTETSSVAELVNYWHTHKLR